MQFSIVSCVAIAGSLASIEHSLAHGLSAKQATSTWIKISPARVTLAPQAFGGANFGFQALAVDKWSGAVYVGTCYQGLWKSTNQGRSWLKVNTGTGGDLLDTGRLWALAIDPVNPQILYTTAGYGAGGLLKSTDGGKNWVNLLSSDSAVEKNLQSGDISSIAIDPSNHDHIIAGFHGVTSGPYASRGPVIESLDGGTTWSMHPIHSGLGYPQYVHFLNKSSQWLVATTVSGLWRTGNSGHSWTQVSKQVVTDGGNQIYRAANKSWYVPAFGNLLMSENDGRTWKGISLPVYSTFMSIIGDGNRMYIQNASPGGDPNQKQYYYTSPEKSGAVWSRLGAQVFSDGPMSMAYDTARHIIYSSNWRAGVWKLHI